MAHFSGLLYGEATGMPLTHVAFNGGAPLLNALLGDHIVTGVDTIIDHYEYHKAGKVKIRGILSPERYALAPDVPTLLESGVQGLDVSGWFGVFAPAGTPQNTVALLDHAIQEALADPTFIKRLNDLVIQSLICPARSSGNCRKKNCSNGRQLFGTRVLLLNSKVTLWASTACFSTLLAWRSMR